MRIFSLLIPFLFLTTLTGWETDFEQAKQEAAAEHKLILLNFSGSDWCGPCIRLRKEIFDSETFTDFSTSHLILLNADFPRLKKNKLSAEQQKKNESLADRYNPEGHFPFTLLLDAAGKVLHTWDGYPDISTSSFIKQIKTFTDARP